jgi:hypothetical protein
MKRRSKNNKIIRYSISYGILVLVAGAIFGLVNYSQSLYKQFEQTGPSLIANEQQKKTVATEVTLPPSIDLTVPYVPQAPFNNWAVHEESCEEAALLMYHEYLNKVSYPNNRVPDATADTIMRAMKAWQVTNYGAERDLTMEALGKFAHDYYGFNFHVTTKITDNDIKTAIYDGTPVLVPVMTHSLENNMYGPYTVYHVLFVKGYDATGVFTNDAGVGNGPDHHYDWKILWQAIDAQTPKMGQGRVMLTISK